MAGTILVFVPETHFSIRPASLSSNLRCCYLCVLDSQCLAYSGRFACACGEACVYSINSYESQHISGIDKHGRVMTIRLGPLGSLLRV